MDNLFELKEKCCGCAACAYVCPRKAITMEEDYLGSRYPFVNENLCIKCGKCIQVCQYHTGVNTNSVICSYAGQNSNENQLLGASSGGIFTAMAISMLLDGGAVCGAMMTKENKQFNVRHVLVENVENINQLQGSKYVQSTLDDVYHDLESALKADKRVLFSGTPCQVAAVRNVFRSYEDRIFFVDIICHGTPTLRFFNDFISFTEKQISGEITEYIFRDKGKGWNHLQGYYCVKYPDGSVETVNNNNNHSYYRLFLNGETYRENCYSCPYANTNRVGDITIGDYWGIDRHNPELLMANGGMFDKQKGISCILVNTTKGKEMLDHCAPLINKAEVPIENITDKNTQLKHPTTFTEMRAKVLKAYQEKGYSEVDKLFTAYLRRKNVKRNISQIIPEPVKKFLKSELLKKR